MALCPFAKHMLIAPGSDDPPITPRMVILHVADSDAWSLFDYFDGRSGGIESHFYITWRGKIEQYRDTAYQADANYLANDFAVSIETQGWGRGRWNARQLEAIKQLLVWLSEEHGIPLREVRTWDGSGVGYHTMFGAPSEWTPKVKSCPGPARKVQFHEELVPWMKTLPTPTQLLRKAVTDAMRLQLNIPPTSVRAHAMCEAIWKALREGPKR